VNFITGLFSDSGNSLLTMVFALGAVLVLIVLGVWLLKLISNVSGNAVRGRNRRLSVVDTLAIDQKRQLLVIRRDNVEHLILVGGPQDVVVETGIPVEEQPAAASGRRPVPSVAARARPAQAPAPVAPPEPTPAAAPVEPETTAAPAKPATAIEQLRELGQPGAQRSRRSLRHTGLLRPVSVQDDGLPGNKSDKAPVISPDSAKQDRADEPMESAAFEQEHGNEANRS
jgi:flagellar protein FliO/FliZ